VEVSLKLLRAEGKVEEGRWIFFSQKKNKLFEKGESGNFVGGDGDGNEMEGYERC
jgi:hypothetical protein